MRISLLLSCLFFASSLAAQDKYWVFLTDKNTNNYDYRCSLSPEAIEKRKLLNLPLEQYTDIPLCKNYLEDLVSSDIQLVHASKWMNAVSAHMEADQVAMLMKKPYVKAVTKIRAGTRPLSTEGVFTDEDYQRTIRLMNGQVLPEAGLTGKGVRVGVIDAGFYGAPEEALLAHLYTNRQIVAVRDFVDPGSEDFYTIDPADNHGTQVLTFVAGARDTVLFGSAAQATYLLARSEDVSREVRLEEDNWIAALEWMDSLGVRIVTTSLGYNRFDDGSGYTVDQMDGETAVLSVAARIAVEEKGIFVLVAAGNEGHSKKWGIVLSPADARPVLAVGACNERGEKMSYSSTGPDYTDFVKPDVVTYSRFGTSFATPAVAGLVACLIQYDPARTNKELLEIIRVSATLYPYGNNYVGYGVPQAERAFELLKNKPVRRMATEMRVQKAKAKVPTTGAATIILFHKTNDRIVWKQEHVPVKKRRLKIRRPEGVRKTTVFAEKQLYEIVWEE